MHDFPPETLRERLERIESIKAGSLGGVATGIVYGMTICIDAIVWHEYSKSLLSLGLATAIAIVCGFLFGVTYRYVIRTDRNDHLNDGVVLAFGLVRGLAQVDVSAFTLWQVWVDGLIVGKSLVLFAIARYTIDYALSASWVLPITRSTQQQLGSHYDVAAATDSIEDRELATTFPHGLNK
jgi:hypothetical protein